MTTALLEVVTCDDGCGSTIEYGTPRVHIDRGWYQDPALPHLVEFVELDFVDFTHVLNYVNQQQATVQALVAQAVLEAPVASISDQEAQIGG